MKQDSSSSDFEKFRKDRNYRRRQKAEPLRPLGRNADVLKELAAAEQREIRNEQLTRDVHDFFADATRTAASIVTRVAKEEEQTSAEHVRSDMQEFLSDVIQRAETFMQLLRRQVNPNTAETNLETSMQNLVGQCLDAFRNEGTAQVQDKHIGQDPFSTDVASDKPTPQSDEVNPVGPEPVPPTAAKPSAQKPPVQRPRPVASPQAVPDPLQQPVPDHPGIEDHLVAETTSESLQLTGDPDSAEPADPEELKQAVGLLVRSGVLSLADARMLVGTLERE